MRVLTCRGERVSEIPYSPLAGAEQSHGFPVAQIHFCSHFSGIPLGTTTTIPPKRSSDFYCSLIPINCVTLIQPENFRTLPGIPGNVTRDAEESRKANLGESPRNGGVQAGVAAVRGPVALRTHSSGKRAVITAVCLEFFPDVASGKSTSSPNERPRITGSGKRLRHL